MHTDELLRKPFTLALGGGGARGLAHIGVLKVLEAHGLLPSLIVGSSMGAIVGAMYSQLRDSSRVQKLIEAMLYRDCFTNLRLDLIREDSLTDDLPSKKHLLDYLRLRLYFSRAVTKWGAIENSILIRLLSRLLKNEDIKSSKIPFVAVAVSLVTGEEKLLADGPIIKAVAASSAIPGVITPVEIDGDILIDGSVLQVVPVYAAKSMSSNPILAVDVSRGFIHESLPKTGFDVILRAGLIANRRLNMQLLKEADLIITPDVSNAEWSDFHSISRLIEAGEKAAQLTFEKEGNIRSLTPVSYDKTIIDNSKFQRFNSSFLSVQ